VSAFLTEGGGEAGGGGGFQTVIMRVIQQGVIQRCKKRGVPGGWYTRLLTVSDAGVG